MGLEKRATWLELFYDLIFVAAFIQLGNLLSASVSVETSSSSLASSSRCG
jgi:low temperature requirement protein LtrA